jgi:alpha-beta hydrolase superfamily lysophospholipase
MAPKFTILAELLTADEDAYVSTDSAIELCKLMPNCVHKPYLKTRHVMLQERDEVRDKVMAAIKDFLVVETPRDAELEK